MRSMLKNNWLRRREVSKRPVTSQRVTSNRVVSSSRPIGSELTPMRQSATLLRPQTRVSRQTVTPTRLRRREVTSMTPTSPLRMTKLNRSRRLQRNPKNDRMMDELRTVRRRLNETRKEIQSERNQQWFAQKSMSEREKYKQFGVEEHEYNDVKKIVRLMKKQNVPFEKAVLAAKSMADKIKNDAKIFQSPAEEIKTPAYKKVGMRDVPNQKSHETTMVDASIAASAKALGVDSDE